MTHLSTVEELKKRIDQVVLDQLADDKISGQNLTVILESALIAGSRFAIHAVPTFLEIQPGFMKEVELLKAYEVLLRRKGYVTEAASINAAVRDMIEAAIEKHEASSKPIMDSVNRFHTTVPLHSKKEWRGAFEPGKHEREF